MKKVKKVPFRQRIVEMLQDAHTDLPRRYNGKSNVGHFLSEIFFWQEISDIADKRLKQAWALAQGDTGPIDADDDLRDHGTGEFVVCESEFFSCKAIVRDPRMNFDRDLFLSALCKVYKLNRGDVDKLAEQCRVQTVAPLSKAVLEAP